MSGFEYIRRTYQVPAAELGRRIVYFGGPEPVRGTIVGYDGDFLLARLDCFGPDQDPCAMHPKVQVEYLDEVIELEGDDMSKKEQAAGDPLAAEQRAREVAAKSAREILGLSGAYSRPVPMAEIITLAEWILDGHIGDDGADECREDGCDIPGHKPTYREIVFPPAEELRKALRSTKPANVTIHGMEPSTSVADDDERRKPDVLDRAAYERRNADADDDGNAVPGTD